MELQEKETQKDWIETYRKSVWIEKICEKDTWLMAISLLLSWVNWKWWKELVLFSRINHALCIGRHWQNHSIFTMQCFVCHLYNYRSVQ